LDGSASQHALRSSISGVSDRLPAVRAAALKHSRIKNEGQVKCAQRGQVSLFL
jgi:hypothetical protein